jgi:AcrR family transcriptional regulator
MNESHSSPDTRREILDAAARLFARDGIASTSMREIGKACDVKAGSIYYHFKSKDEIVAEILDLGIRLVSDAVRVALAQSNQKDDFRNRLHVAVRAHLNAFFLYGDYTKTHVREFKQTPARIQKKNIKNRDFYERLWVDLLAQGVSEGALSRDIDLNLARIILLSSMNFALEWFHPKGQRNVDELAAVIVRIFLDGCAVRLEH